MLCTIAFCLLAQAADSPRPPALPFPAEESRRYQKESADLAKLPVKCEHPEGITLKLVPHFGHSNPGFGVAGRLRELEPRRRGPGAQHRQRRRDRSFPACRRDHFPGCLRRNSSRRGRGQDGSRLDDAKVA
jgi:hypothetical protein